MFRDRSPDEFLASDDPDDRLNAVYTAHVRPRRQALPVLVDALADADDDVSGRAGAMLGGLATATHVPRFIREYVDPTRFADAYPYDIPYFDALEELGGPSAAWEPLVDAMVDAADPAVVRRIVMVLEWFVDGRARPTLERLLDEHTDEARRSTVAGAATQLLERVAEAEDRAAAMPSRDDIRVALDAASYDDRERAQRRLDEWAATVEADALIDALGDERSSISAAAANALGIREVAEAVPALVPEVANPERSIAAAVVEYPYAEASDLRHTEHARALVRLDDRAAVEPLLKAFGQSGDPWIDWDIGWVLGWLGDPRAVEAVSTRLDSLRDVDGSGWRYRTLVSDAAADLNRLRHSDRRCSDNTDSNVLKLVQGVLRKIAR